MLLVCLGSACDKSAGASGDRGSQLFASVCARCHGDDGSGGLPVPTGQRPRNFRDAAFHGERNDGDLRQVIIQGKPPGMPAFGAVFKADEIDALVAHVRSFNPGR